MYVKCQHCKNRFPVVVNDWNIIPVDNNFEAIKIGMYGNIGFNPDTPFKIKPSPVVYRCSNCGFEKQYGQEDIIFG